MARRDRKLLLNRKEIARIAKAVEDPGYTVIPLKVFISDRGYAKIQIGVGRGKNNTTNARRYGNARTSARWTDSSRNDTTS